MRTKQRQPKTQCPHCGHWDSDVISGEPMTHGGYRRFRRCRQCSMRYTATERVDPVQRPRSAGPVPR